jgi:rhamnulokinase
MSKAAQFLALDLGAESGRGVVGSLDNGKLSLQEFHRFPNGPVILPDGMHWDILGIFRELKAAIGAASQSGADIQGIGIDTWGVDFGLLGKGDRLLENPYHYRDARTAGMIDEACRRVPRAEIFGQTGIQFIELNTVFQLMAMVVQESPTLKIAERLLLTPDLLNFWFTGNKVSEFSIATTSQCYNPLTGDWAFDMLERLGIPTGIFGEIVQPGTIIGSLLPTITDELGVGSIPVIAPGCHDTASAVAGVPAKGDDYAYLSSGTWSLMGVEITEPIVNEDALANNITNEGGVCGTFRFLKNIMGLWLVQESRRTWQRLGEDLSYDDITALAEAAPAFQSFVQPDAASFLRPGDMPRRIQEFCCSTGQAVPQDKGAIVRCALESLALRYRWVMERLEQITGRRRSVVHIVGGGSQNALLCQFTADALGRPVHAGPVEATAIGNILMQALALGHISSLEEGREIVRNSFDVITYEPQNTDAWEEAYPRFLAATEKGETFA